ncbi:hypothetical protein JCM10914A_24430 [Paenibacillus sp. JCM 10914]
MRTVNMVAAVRLRMNIGLDRMREVLIKMYGIFFLGICYRGSFVLRYEYRIRPEFTYCRGLSFLVTLCNM